jgi:ribonuclease HII
MNRLVSPARLAAELGIALAVLERACGVDEAGRGPLAGPVVVAAVVLDPAQPIAGLDDSKKLEPAEREALAPLIRAAARGTCVVVVPAAEVDALNVLGATLAGMARAVAGLAEPPPLALIDGDRPPKLSVPLRTVVRGDGKVPAIAAASVLAKVARDALMVELDALHPGYGFAKHKGYPTPEHLAALKRLGPCVEHRRSFAPVRAVLEGAA